MCMDFSSSLDTFKIWDSIYTFFIIWVLLSDFVPLKRIDGMFKIGSKKDPRSKARQHQREENGAVWGEHNLWRGQLHIFFRKCTFQLLLLITAAVKIMSEYGPSFHNMVFSEKYTLNIWHRKNNNILIFSCPCSAWPPTVFQSSGWFAMVGRDKMY